MKDRISILEVDAIRYFLIRASFISLALTSLLNVAKQDSYISVLLGFIFALFIFFIYYKIINIDKDSDLISLINNKLGNGFGKIISLIVIAVIAVYASKIFMYLIDVTKYHYLDGFNVVSIGLLFLVPSVYLVSKDINGIGRVSLILLFMSAIFLVFSLIFIVPKINFNNFRPFIGEWKNIFNGSLIFSSIFIPLFMLGIIPKNKIDNNDYLHKSFIFYLFDLLILLIIIFSFIGLNNVDYVLLFKYPAFQMFNSISIQGSQQFFYIQWIIDSFIFLVFSIYTISTILKTNFNIKIKYSNLMISVLILLLALII